MTLSLSKWTLATCLIAVLLSIGCTSSVGTFVSPRADVLLQAHTRAFYQVDDSRAWLKETTAGGKVSFWMWAEQMEMELDAYERTRNPQQLEIFTKLFNGFMADHGNWMSNEYNDDIMWMVIASARGYLLSGNPAFRDAARRNFDACFARAWSTNIGGGLWWRTDNQSKNACVNGPAAIAAVLLSQACRDTTYLTKATNLFLWERATLYDPASGQVYDNIRRNGRISYTSFSYNQGTFVGAAYLLGYTNEAMQAANYTMDRLCRNGLLPAADENGDGGGFNGICARWIARFMYADHCEPIFERWLQKNADAAWNVRRPEDNLSWCRWQQQTPAGKRYSWGCSSSVVILQVVRPLKTF